MFCQNNVPGVASLLRRSTAKAYRVAQKSKPLPSDQKTVLNHIEACQSDKIYDLFVKLKYESSTTISFIGIRYSMRNRLSDLNNYAQQTGDMHQIQ